MFLCSVMGRDTGSLRIDKKPLVGKVNSNGMNRTSARPSGEGVHIRISEAEEGSQVQTSSDKQLAANIITTNQDVVSPMGKTPKPEPSKSSEKVVSSPVSPASGSASLEEHVAGGLHISSNTSSFHSPMKTKQSQVYIYSNDAII